MNPIIQESKTLWIGDIDHWMDESYIASLFAGSGAVNSVKVIRDKNTGLPAGYGFVEFRDHSAANNVLTTYHGKTIPGTNKTFKLNWGVFGGGTKAGETTEKPERGERGERGERSSRFSSRFSSQQQQQQQAPEPTPVQNKSAAPGPEHSIYVGELDASVNESVLTEFFQRRYRSVLGSKVITDPVTKQCKGFGFVKFSDNNEAQAAIREMQGSILRGRALKTSQAYTKNQTQDTTTTNLSSMMNPYAMLANNPMLLNTLGSLSGLGGMPGMAGMQGMAGMAGMGAYGAQNMQYGAYGAGMMGGQMMQGYGQAQGMYGYGGDMQQQQVYQGYGQQQQQAYGQQQPQVAQMGGNAFVGSYFDPLNQAGGYQQYGVAQQGQPQMYGQDGSSYLPQQQQQQYNVYTPQSGGQVNVYGVQQQVYQAVDANNLNVNQQGGGQNGAENNGHGQVETSAAAVEKGNMEEEAGEEVMRYNSTCIGNSFHFDFINGEKINTAM